MTINLQTFCTSVNLIGLSENNEGRLSGGTNDPQIIYNLKEPCQPGWYRLEFSMLTSQVLEACVYYDFGFGFNEIHTSDLVFDAKRHMYTTVVRLPVPVVAFRLDPHTGPVEIDLKRAEIIKQNGLTKGKYLTGLAIKKINQNPTSFLRNTSVYFNGLRAGTFLNMKGHVHGTNSTRPGTGDFKNWIEKYDFKQSRDTAPLKARIDALKNPPKISVVMPVYETPVDLLDAAIKSVVNQIYPNWEFCIADDCSKSPAVRRTLKRWAAKDKRIKVVFREENGHISHATNSAFELVESDWIALLDHDDVLRPHALAEVALEISAHPDAQLIYSDEDKIDERGKRRDAFFKPDYSREMFRSQNYFNHLTVHRTQNIRDVGGWRVGLEGSQDYDLNLRIVERVDPQTIRHIPKILYHWRAVAGSTAADGAEKSYAYAAGMRALKDHIARTGFAAEVEEAPGTPFYRIRPHITKPEPLVSLIIPTRDGVDLLRGCIESIREKTTYKNYEIIVVDNGSADPETLAYFRKIGKRKNTRVLKYNKPFNYSAINNFAVKKSKGEIIGLINNDIEVISPEWLTEMVSWAALSDVGCVGAKLYYANDTIQHAGVILGLGGVAGHSHKYFPRENDGYFNRLKIPQNLSAVTAACLLVRKRVFQKVDGLNAKNLTVAFNDVDFCLKVATAGYNNVFTPFAELYHHESVSRGAEDSPEKIARFAKEVAYMKDNWSAQLDADPYYSVSLTRATEDFRIRD